MKKIKISTSLVITLAITLVLLTNCLKTENPIVYEKGTFPDTVVNLQDLNSIYDDYNVGIYSLYANVPLVFSSNRGSEGGQFDLVQGILSYAFDQTNSAFWLGAEIITDPFLTKLLQKVNTERNDFGPYRLYNADDGYEYLILSSENADGNLDFFYTRNLPVFGGAVPDVEGPFPLTLLNSPSNEGYITFKPGLDTAYFTSDAAGNFDIYTHTRPDGTNLQSWFNLSFATSSPVDMLNSASDDKCPNLLGNIMVFTSDRPGGLGGFDLYYSVLTDGEWSSPVNMGAPINTASDEYRPMLGGHIDFINNYLLFSSNRPGGEGGFDLYFAGITFPD
jgi:hypothetical protein